METRSAFLAAYAGAAQGSPPLYGAIKPGEACSVVRVEKVLYELRYEIGNRPTWPEFRCKEFSIGAPISEELHAKF